MLSEYDFKVYTLYIFTLKQYGFDIDKSDREFIKECVLLDIDVKEMMQLFLYESLKD